MYCGRKRDGERRFTRINHIHALCMLCLTSCAISEFPIWFHYFRSNRLQLDFETQQFSQTRDLTVQLGEKQISVWLLAGLKTNSPTCTRSSHSISFEWKIWGAFESVIRACKRGKRSFVASLDCDDAFNDYLRRYFARSLSFVVVMLIDSHWI